MLRTAFLPVLLVTSTLMALPAYAETPAKPDSDMQAVLDAHAGLKPKPIETLTPAEARKQPTPADGAKLVMKEKGKDPNDPMGVTTKDISVKGAAGSIPARIYTPEKADGKNALPVVVYYHGGGFVIADLNVYDATPRAIAKQANAIVVSVHYRQAPENKFPAAQDDAFAAYQCVLANAGSFGGDPKRVAVMGESAGGNLAINTAIKARDSKVQAPVHEVLIYPVAGVDMKTPSYQENADAKPLNKAMMAWFMKHFTKGEKDKQDARLDIIGKADVSGLPATTIILAQIDPLRSDGEMLGTRLQEAGVAVNSKTYEGATHEFFGMGAVVGDAKDAEGVVADDLKTAFSR